MSSYRFISAERASFPVSLLCVVLEVSKSGFYAWTTRAPSDRTLSDAWLSERIRKIHGDARGVYGARRIHAELRHAHGVRVGRKRKGHVYMSCDYGRTYGKVAADQIEGHGQWLSIREERPAIYSGSQPTPGDPP